MAPCCPRGSDMVFHPYTTRGRKFLPFLKALTPEPLCLIPALPFLQGRPVISLFLFWWCGPGDGIAQPPWCYSALCLILKMGVFRRINWRLQHTHLICRLTIFHVLHTRKSRPLAACGKP